MQIIRRGDSPGECTAVLARVAEGRMASSSGSNKDTPAPRNSVLRFGRWDDIRKSHFF
jgi:hypothetical protein